MASELVGCDEDTDDTEEGAIITIPWCPVCTSGGDATGWDIVRDIRALLAKARPGPRIA